MPMEVHVPKEDAMVVILDINNKGKSSEDIASYQVEINV